MNRKLHTAGRLIQLNPGMASRYAWYRTRRALPGWRARGQRQVRFGDVVLTYDCDRVGGELIAAQMAHGFYQMPVVAALRRYLAPGDVFFDVGANVGYMTAIAADLVGPTGMVAAFEPVPELHDRLYALRQANPRYRILPEQVAAYSCNGTARMDVATWGYAGGSSLAGLLSPAHIRQQIDVPTLRLDHYIEIHGLRPDVIKIDVEGAEWPVLLGLEGYLKNARPVIICEVTPESGTAPSVIADYMAGFGYQAFDAINERAPVRLSALRSGIDVVFRA